MHIIFEASASTAIGVIIVTSSGYAAGIFSSTFAFSVVAAMCAGMSAIAYYADNPHLLFTQSNVLPTTQEQHKIDQQLSMQ